MGESPKHTARIIREAREDMAQKKQEAAATTPQRKGYQLYGENRNGLLLRFIAPKDGLIRQAKIFIGANGIGPNPNNKGSTVRVCVKDREAADGLIFEIPPNTLLHTDQPIVVRDSHVYELRVEGENADRVDDAILAFEM